MSNKELQDNQKIFLDMINHLHNLNDENNNIHIQRYIQQNIIIINHLIAISINNLFKIKNAKSQDEIICTQARFFNEINKQLSILKQHFLNESLGHTMVDHDAWLAAHCDLATD